MWGHGDETNTLLVAGMTNKSGMNHARFVQKIEQESGDVLLKRITNIVVSNNRSCCLASSNRSCCLQVVKYVASLR